jgi:hypothetical protein
MLAYASIEEDDSVHGTEWWIWPPECIPAISNIWHSDADRDLRWKVFMATGFPPWRIQQKPGDAVVVPAGYPYLVSLRFPTLTPF